MIDKLKLQYIPPPKIAKIKFSTLIGFLNTSPFEITNKIERNIKLVKQSPKVLQAGTASLHCCKNKRTNNGNNTDNIKTIEKKH